ncbi:MAG: Rrf2 family transcriptional regulator [Ignavibacteria bacterium]|nr:Rrf2 family transcriptional regulator [Ignavibacteria bacterium]
MKFSAQEEYGLRCLLRIAKFYHTGKSLTIPEISRSEGISEHNTGKILRVLRLGGLLQAERGQFGGYTLSRSPEEIKIDEVLFVLGGKLYDDSFCQSHSGVADFCTNSIDCSVRSLWKIIQDTVNSVTKNLTLKDLMGSESDLFEIITASPVKLINE